MRQPVKDNLKKYNATKKKRIVKSNSFKKYSNYKRKTNKHAEYGTSKLERDFAKDFLDKLGLSYIYQYKAESIGRYYDFAVIYDDGCKFKMEEKDGIKCIKQDGQAYRIEALIEVDGDYYHSNSKLVKEENMNPMQKHNKRVDGYKNKYASENSLVLLRIWEDDIRHNPEKVKDTLLNTLTIQKEKIDFKIAKKQRMRKPNYDSKIEDK